MTYRDELIEAAGRAIALADDEDYMEDHRRYDRRAKAALDAWLMREQPDRELGAAALRVAQIVRDYGSTGVTNGSARANAEAIALLMDRLEPHWRVALRPA